MPFVDMILTFFSSKTSFGIIIFISNIKLLAFLLSLASEISKKEMNSCLSVFVFMSNRLKCHNQLNINSFHSM